jgi:RnfABCDGE-type electron transport complex D subunit
VGDLSACVTGLILALSLPSSAAWWVPILGGAFAIVVVKQFYGGLGKNFMNPALAGRMLLATFPRLMTSWTQPLLWNVDAVSAATPMSYLHEGNLPPQSLAQLFLGYQGGCMGEVSSFVLLLGGMYLISRRVISARIPAAFLGTVAVLSLLFPKGNGGALVWTATQLLSGGLLLGAFFVATDPTTSPVTPRGQLLYGAGCGALTMLLRYHSSYPEGVGWAILTMNCCVWLLDRAGMPRRFGVAPFSGVKNFLLRIRVSISKIKFVKPELRLPKVKRGEMPGEAHLDQIRSGFRSLCALAAVLGVVGFMIWRVDRVTDLDTARAETQTQQELLAQAMPQATYRSEVPFRANGALSITAGYSSDNQLVGYCVEVQSQGFGGAITMVVGVDLDGKVTGVAVTDHKETIGTQAMTEEALSRYVGRSGTIRTSGRNTVDVVSGATATSKALTVGVNRALAIVATLDTEGDTTYYADSEN